MSSALPKARRAARSDMERSTAARSAERNGKIAVVERCPSAFKPAAASVTATKQAAAGLFGMIQQQAAIMGYVDVFRLLAVMFAVCLPLILIMKKPPKGGGGPGSMAH